MTFILLKMFRMSFSTKESSFKNVHVLGIFGKITLIRIRNVISSCWDVGFVFQNALEAKFCCSKNAENLEIFCKK